MDFATLIVREREKLGLNTRAFHSRFKLTCSYFYYLKVEQGTIPSIDLALEIIEKLKLNRRKSLYAWTRDQMKTADDKAIFTEIGDEAPVPADQLSIDRTVVVNRMQSELLCQNPLYWEILLFLSLQGSKEVTLGAISQSFRMASAKMKGFLEELYRYGLISKGDKGFFTKGWVFIPYDQEFEDVRDINFRRAFDQFFKYKGEPKFRSTVTHVLSKKQLRQLEQKAIALINSVVGMKPDGRETVEPVTLGIFASSRLFGND